MDLRRICACLLACALAGGAALAQTKELHWRSLDVRARLDAEGALHVRETQAIVFNGDWNGGERSFSIRAGQRLKFERLVERDERGETVRTLRRGDLDEVGEFRWFDGHVLRWRARLPGDPPFQDALRIYELDYVITGVLSREEDGYLLAHDFAFPDRTGIIEHLHGELSVDPAWRPLSTLDESFDVESLAPGQGEVRSALLEYVGTGQPLANGEVRPAPGLAADVAFMLLVALVLAGAVVVVRRERERGRFEPLDGPDSIDAAWLAEHLLRFRAEDVGAAWDGKISTHEVMAVLARMSQAGQLTSEVKTSGAWIFKSHVLHLRLEVDAESLPATERALVRKLFFDGRTTDTDRIRAHYRSSGFDPASAISKLVEPRAERIVGQEEPRHSTWWKVSAGLIAIGILGVAIGAYLEPGTAAPIIVTSVALLALLLIAALFARRYRREATASLSLALAALLPSALALWILWWVVHTPRFTLVEGIGASLLALGMLHVVLTNFLCRRNAEDLRRRRRFLAARNWFRRELRQPSPNLDDAWLPYLLAFGLGPDVDRWFKVSGGAVSGTHWPDASSASSGRAGTPCPPTWTGGGGSFGGAGATGTWVAAVGTLAAGVSAPSSSGGGSSGGGGGGGGGSSGGGGGGGW